MEGGAQAFLRRGPCHGEIIGRWRSRGYSFSGAPHSHGSGPTHSTGHAVPGGGVIARETAVHVVISEHVVARAGVGIPQVKERLIGRCRFAEITELDDEVRLCGAHGVEKGAEAPGAVGHNIVVDVADHADADATVIFGARGGGPGQRERGGGGGQAGEEAAAGQGGFHEALELRCDEGRSGRPGAVARERSTPK